MQLLRLLENVNQLKPGSKWKLIKTITVTYLEKQDLVRSMVSPFEDWDIGTILVDRIEGGNVYFKFTLVPDQIDSREMWASENVFLDSTITLREYNRKFLQGLVDPDSSEEK